jgi:aldose 1-epimerase
MTTPPSGQQFEIASGAHRATIVEVGGGIRTYEVGDRSVLHPYDLDAMCDGAHGAPLIPWPNRLADGRYEFEGQELQVDLTEPTKKNAIHGFLRWRPWSAEELGSDQVVMRTRLYPMTGYPFMLDVAVDYHLTGNGLLVQTTATNIGDAACPYGCGQHPYLSPGEGRIDDCHVTVTASTRIDTDDERQLPTGREPVEGTTYDFRQSTRLGDRQVDYAFTDLLRDSDGLAWTHLQGTDGATASLWADESYEFLEIFTADTLADERSRRGLGVEPMTCAPNAFNSGEGLVVLQPGEALTTRWGATLT